MVRSSWEDDVRRRNRQYLPLLRRLAETVSAATDTNVDACIRGLLEGFTRILGPMPLTGDKEVRKILYPDEGRRRPSVERKITPVPPPAPRTPKRQPPRSSRAIPQVTEATIRAAQAYASEAPDVYRTNDTGALEIEPRPELPPLPPDPALESVRSRAFLPGFDEGDL